MARIRLTRIPSARDFEYLAIRYLQQNGVYDAPLEIAHDLIALGYASLVSSSEALTDVTDRLGDSDSDAD